MASAGTSIFTFHIEVAESIADGGNLAGFITHIKDKGMKAGIAVKPK
jgi:pentose-5-phosphate-3-epimerase